MAATDQPRAADRRTKEGDYAAALSRGEAQLPDALYFGCWDRTGHRFHRPNGSMPWYHEVNDALPWDGSVDGGIAKVGSQPQGTAYLNQRDGWTALVVADRTVDHRGGSHSTFLFHDLLDPRRSDMPERAEEGGSVKPLSERPNDQWCDRHHRYGCCPTPSTLPRAGRYVEVWSTDLSREVVSGRRAPDPSGPLGPACDVPHPMTRQKGRNEQREPGR